MPHRRVRLVADGADLRARFAAVRTELGVPATFAPEVLAAADEAAKVPRLPSSELLDVAFVTIDPPGSMDLDQAMHLERRARGYRIRYAIADVAAFVTPGGVLDAEAHRRGETLYSPDLRTPLYPPALGEAAASLLPGEVRPAIVWTIDLDADAAFVAADVGRALVRSRARLDYAGAERSIETGDDDLLALLRTVGELRQQQEVARGAVSLRLPEQEVDADGDGFRLHYRAPAPVEDWNAQISLLTGMTAAQLMLDAGIGVLRTLPPPDPGAVAMLRRSAAALDVHWPGSVPYPTFLRGLDPGTDSGAALLELATRLLRGAGYTAFDGSAPVPLEHASHSAVAAPYAHATAPLRRLVDRYVGELCVAVCAGEEVPSWVRAGLPELPEVMDGADHRAHALEHACVDLVEAVLLATHVGETFSAEVVEHNHHGGVVQLRAPAVRARCEGPALRLGERLEVRLVEADPDARAVLFAPA